jgi:hypothetical protein
MKVTRPFERAYCLHLGSKKVSQAAKQHETSSKQPEDGDDVFLRNVH